jgi:hypothetical protein
MVEEQDTPCNALLDSKCQVPYATLLARLATMATAQSAGSNVQQAKLTVEALSVLIQPINAVISPKALLRAF